MMKRLLNVKRTSNSEIADKWELDFRPFQSRQELFVRCNAKGVVKWDTALVYTLDELLKRGNVQIIE